MLITLKSAFCFDKYNVTTSFDRIYYQVTLNLVSSFIKFFYLSIFNKAWF